MIMKFVIKTIANKLKVLLSDVIDEEQSISVKERLITDNALIV